MPNGRCRLHGGKSLSGIASPSFRTGASSRSLPLRMAAAAAAAANDPTLMDLRRDVVLVEARITDVLTRVDTGESGAIWTGLLRAKAELQAGQQAKDFKRQTDALTTMQTLIDAGHADDRAWDAVGALLEQRRKIIDSEHKHLIAAEQMITKEQLMLLMGLILGVIREHVQDRKALDGIQRDITALTEVGA